MASIQKEINNADSHMTLQSLTVIKDIKSKGFKTIKTELESVKKSTQQFAKKQNEFWNNISSDGIIAVNEKTLLKKEWQQIDQTHTAILKLAQEGNLEDSEDVKFYDEKYNALYEYLFSTLKLFDDMSKTTNIANRDKFNSFFADYYEAETEIQTKLAIGMVDVQGMRILDNLNVIGLKDEIAIYSGKLYQYVNNEWVLIPSDGYLGIKDNCPTGAIGQFFLAGDSDFYYPIKIKIGENFLQTTDGRFILATKKVEKGFIYAFTETGWVKIIDKNDYRYIIAINDLITLGESLSDNLQGIFDAINGRLDDAESSLQNKIEYVPSYLGMFEADPKDAKEGDWYVYNGVETTERNKGKVYLYQMNTEGTALSWVKLTPSDTNNSKYFMAALNDILASMDAEPGYFSEVFCNAFFANAASISALQTQTIKLSDGGMIKSNDEIYDQKKRGMCIRSDGYADFNGDTHIGGNLTVDGVTTLGNDTKVLGDAWFLGRIDSGPLYLADEDPSSESSQEILSGYNTMDFFKWCNSKGESLRLGSANEGNWGLLKQHFNGTIGGVAFTLVYWQPNTSTSAGYFSFRKKDGTEVAKYYLDNWTNDYDSLPDIILDLYTPGGRTLKLRDLPTSPGAVSGVVYVTAEGYLRVTL